MVNTTLQRKQYSNWAILFSQIQFTRLDSNKYYAHLLRNAVGLFSCDKFEVTPKQKVIELSKF